MQIKGSMKTAAAVVTIMRSSRMELLISCSLNLRQVIDVSNRKWFAERSSWDQERALLLCIHRHVSQLVR